MGSWGAGDDQDTARSPLSAGVSGRVKPRNYDRPADASRADAYGVLHRLAPRSGCQDGLLRASGADDDSPLQDSCAVFRIPRFSVAANTLFTRLERKHSKAKALSILAHKIGRAVYFMLARKTAFDLERFLKS